MKINSNDAQATTADENRIESFGLYRFRVFDYLEVFGVLLDSGARPCQYGKTVKAKNHSNVYVGRYIKERKK